MVPPRSRRPTLCFGVSGRTLRAESEPQAGRLSSGKKPNFLIPSVHPSGSLPAAQKYHRTHLTDLAFTNLGFDLGTSWCTGPRPPRQAIHSLHSLSRLPSNVDQLEHLELGLLDMQVFVEAAALAPLGHYCQVVLCHVPHEKQDVHVPGFAGEGRNKRLRASASADREIHPAPECILCATDAAVQSLGSQKQSWQTAPTQLLLWAGRAALDASLDGRGRPLPAAQTHQTPHRGHKDPSSMEPILSAYSYKSK